MAMNFDKFNFVASAKDSFQRIQKLRDTYDKIRSVKASCEGNLGVVEGIINFRSGVSVTKEKLLTEQKRLQSYLKSMENLEARIKNTTDLVSYSFGGFPLTVSKSLLTLEAWLCDQFEESIRVHPSRKAS